MIPTKKVLMVFPDKPLCACGCGKRIEITRLCTAIYRRDCQRRRHQEYNTTKKFNQLKLKKKIRNENRSVCECGCRRLIEPNRRANTKLRKDCIANYYYEHRKNRMKQTTI